MQNVPNELKFIDNIELDEGWEIETDTGFKPISKIYKTIEYEKYILKTENELLECADNHIVFDENYNEVFVKDLKSGDKIQVKNGVETVISIENTHIKENMYDMTVDDENHRYYTNGILSHNTTTTVCFLLWFVIFHADKRCAILANKGATARQIVGRIELAYMNLPKWLQQGVSDWNKGSFGLENGSSIMSAATSSDSVRGESYSCVKGNTKVTILDDNENIYYIPIDKCNQIQQGTNNMNKKYYYVYKITNNVNNKEYIGFHSTNDLDDGYMGSGKLLIKAIEKYGIENFSKIILKFFDNKKSAEEYERFLVNEEYVNREDTYNLTIGGNVCILCGEKNGFYGKKHSKETIERIKKSKQGKPVNYPKSIKTTELKIGFNTFNSFNEACKFTGLTRREINILLYYDKNCYIIDKEKHNKFIVEYEEYLKEKEIKAKLHWERVREYMKSDKHRQEVSKAHKGKLHPWNIETNKNPEKIEKTAAKHRGMKRSPETCQKISNSLKKRKGT